MIVTLYQALAYYFDALVLACCASMSRRPMTNRNKRVVMRTM